MGLAARIIAVAMFVVLAGCVGTGVVTPPENIEPGGMFAPKTMFEDGRGGPLPALASGADYILVGEGHTIFCDHKVQASVIEALADNTPVIGLEMVSVERQDVLDRFNAGEMRIAELREALNWDKTWGHPFRLYVPVFGAARKYGLDLYALNAPREVVTDISAGGLDAVPEDLKPYMPERIVKPAREQIAELRAIYRAHAPKKKEGDDKAGSFERFLLIQSLWDSAMADNAVRIRRETNRPMIILAGAGHVDYGRGIARRIRVFDPESKTLTVTPWRGMGEPDIAAGDVFFYCPPTHTAKGGYTMAFRPSGIFIADVDPGSPAEEAGFREVDRIAGIEGRRVQGPGELFRAFLEASKAGGGVTFLLEREGGMATAELVLPEEPDDAGESSEPGE